MLSLMGRFLAFIFLIVMQNNETAQYNGHASNMLFMQHFTPTKAAQHPTDSLQIQLDKAKDKCNEYKQGMIQNPGTVTTGGVAGGAFGYGYMQAYLKGAQLGAHHLEQNPKISTNWPTVTSFIKKAAQPNNPGNRGMMLYTIGHYCIIGAGLAISKNETISEKWNNFLDWFKKKI